MRLYLNIIQFLQKTFLGISILTMLVLSPALALYPDWFTEAFILSLYDISHWAVFFVMLIRPLADIVPEVKWIRPLVILRKGIGVLSASIVVSFIFSKLIIDPSGYLHAFGTLRYWSLQKFALLAHLADISAIILLITSNNLSKKLLKSSWKKIQKLSYVFFYSSSLYVFFSFGDTTMLVSMAIITTVTFLAFIRNMYRVPVTVTPTKPLTTTSL